MTYWININTPTTATSASTLTLPAGWATGYSWPQQASPVPKPPPGPLEWLDGEIEKICAIARGGGR